MGELIVAMILLYLWGTFLEKKAQRRRRERGARASGRVVRTRFMRRTPRRSAWHMSLVTWLRPTSSPALTIAFHILHAT